MAIATQLESKIEKTTWQRQEFKISKQLGKDRSPRQRIQQPDKGRSS